MNSSSRSNPQKLLEQATCAIVTDDQVKGTAWLFTGDGHILTAAHVVGQKKPLERVDVQFFNDTLRSQAVHIDSKYDRVKGIDFAIYKCTQMPGEHKPLPLALTKARMEESIGQPFKLFGYGQTLKSASVGTGVIVGIYYPTNSNNTDMLQLRSLELGEPGYSGGAVFCDHIGAVVGIQTEATDADVPVHENTVLAMPLHRIADESNVLRSLVFPPVSLESYTSSLKTYLQNLLDDDLGSGINPIDPIFMKTDGVSQGNLPEIGKTEFWQTSHEDLTIVGPAGSGKSIALVLLAQELLSQNFGRLPVLVLPRHVKQLMGRHKDRSSAWTVEDLGGCLLAAFSRCWSSDTTDAVLKDAFDTLNNEGKLAFLIDAIDEIDKIVPGSGEPGCFSNLLSSLLTQDTQYGKSQFVLTSRPNRYIKPKDHRWCTYELKEWDIKQFKDYFDEEASLFDVIDQSNELQKLLDRPIMCHFLRHIGTDWFDRRAASTPSTQVRELLVAEPTILYTRFVRDSLSKREGISQEAMELLGGIAIKDSVRQWINEKEAMEELAAGFEKLGKDAPEAEAATALEDFQAATLLRTVSNDQPYLHFVHESYRDYAGAYWLNRLISRFDEDVGVDDLSPITNKGREFFSKIGSIKPNISIYAFQRDLACGRLHRRHYRNLVLEFRDVLSVLSAISLHFENLFVELGRSMMENAVTMLTQVLRGFQYAAEAEMDSLEGIHEHAEEFKRVLDRLYREAKN